MQSLSTLYKIGTFSIFNSSIIDGTPPPPIFSSVLHKGLCTWISFLYLKSFKNTYKIKHKVYLNCMYSQIAKIHGWTVAPGDLSAGTCLEPLHPPLRMETYASDRSRVWKLVGIKGDNFFCKGGIFPSKGEIYFFKLFVSFKTRVCG